MLGNRYEPVLLVTLVCGVMSAGLETVTVTPGITAPDESVARPKISPLWACAKAVPALMNSAASARDIHLPNLVIADPPVRAVSRGRTLRVRARTARARGAHARAWGRNRGCRRHPAGSGPRRPAKTLTNAYLRNRPHADRPR